MNAPVIMDWNSTNQAAVAHVGKPAVYLANHLTFDNDGDNPLWEFVITEVQRLYGDGSAAYFEVISQVIHGGLFFFDTAEEQYEFYRIFEQTLTYAGPIYAITYAADGTCETENT